MSDIPREVLAEAEFRQALDNIQAKHGVTILLNKALEEDMPLDRDWETNRYITH